MKLTFLAPIPRRGIVARHDDWIHRALHAATPSVDYLAEDPTRAWPPVRLGTVKGS